MAHQRTRVDVQFFLGRFASPEYKAEFLRLSALTYQTGAYYRREQ